MLSVCPRLAVTVGSVIQGGDVGFVAYKAGKTHLHTWWKKQALRSSNNFTYIHICIHVHTFGGWSKTPTLFFSCTAYLSLQNLLSSIEITLWLLCNFF